MSSALLGLAFLLQLQRPDLNKTDLNLQGQVAVTSTSFSQLPQYVPDILASRFVPTADPAQRHYLWTVKAAGNTFTLKLSWPRPNQALLQVQDNWIPQDWILSEVKNKLAPVLHTLEKLEAQEKLPPGLTPQLKQTGQGLQFNFLPTHTAGYLTPRGDLWLNINTTNNSAHNSANNSAKTPPAQSRSLVPQANALALTLKGQGTLNSASATAPFALGVDHQVQVHLTPDQTAQLTLGDEKITERLSALQASLTGHSQFTGSLEKGRWQGQTQAAIAQLEVNGHSYAGLHSYPLVWQWQVPYTRPSDFEIWPQLPPLPPLPDLQRKASPTLKQPAFVPARLQYTIDGPTYLKALRQAVTQARYRLQQEVFVFYPGQTTQALAELYTLKAMGLQAVKGQLQTDTYAPRGIAVEIMHNHKMSPDGAQKVQALFDQARTHIMATLKAQNMSPATIQALQQRLDKHLQLRALTRGILKINHRKQVIIDNRLAFMGGFNLADHYLSDQGFHDIMYQLTGPIVPQLQQAFADNWQALSPVHKDPFKPLQRAAARHATPVLSEAETRQRMHALPRSHKAPFYTPQVALLLHDHDINTVKPAILRLIQEAKHTLRLEQAYLESHEVLQALRAAKARGVNIEVVVSFLNDEVMFERLNIGHLITLHEAPGTGQVKTWLYRGKTKGQQTPRSDTSYMVHTKYISADGLNAIVGSTNLIPRSLQSPFYGLKPDDYVLSPALFNEEMGLWIQDRDTVSALDRDLVQQDQHERSELMPVEALRQLLVQRGGLWQLLGDQLKGLFS